MNEHLIKDLNRYADLLAEGELVSPDDLNCSAIMRLAAEALAQPAVAEQHKQEPVAWMHPDWRSYTRAPSPSVTPKEGWVPLYTTPPQRDSSATPLTWVGLTNEEIYSIDWKAEPNYARAIEAKLKEKNT